MAASGSVAPARAHEMLYRGQAAASDAIDGCATSAIRSAVSKIFSAGDCALGWVAGPLLDLTCPVNLINGRRQFLCMPRSVEKFFGDWISYPSATYGTRGTNELLPGTDERIADRLNTVMQRIRRANVDLLNPEGETEFDYRLRTVLSSQINAFAVPAGGMVVYTQIVKEINAAIKAEAIRDVAIELADGSSVRVDLSGVAVDDVLAALLGHEMTHIASRHSAFILTAQLVCSFVLSTLRNLLFSQESDWNETLLEMEEWFDALLNNFNSRQCEYEADVTGAYFAHRARLNPLGAIYLQELLNKDRWEYGNFFHKHFEFLYTHPYGEHRKRALFAALSEMQPGALQGRITM